MTGFHLKTDILAENFKFQNFSVQLKAIESQTLFSKLIMLQEETKLDLKNHMFVFFFQIWECTFSGENILIHIRWVLRSLWYILKAELGTKNLICPCLWTLIFFWICTVHMSVGFAFFLWKPSWVFEADLGKNLTLLGTWARRSKSFCRFVAKYYV